MVNKNHAYYIPENNNHANNDWETFFKQKTSIFWLIYGTLDKNKKNHASKHWKNHTKNYLCLKIAVVEAGLEPWLEPCPWPGGCKTLPPARRPAIKSALIFRRPTGWSGNGRVSMVKNLEWYRPPGLKLADRCPLKSQEIKCKIRQPQKNLLQDNFSSL